MERSYCSLSRFSLPLCLYHITLWSLITCADAWDADGPANGAQSVNLLLGPVLPSLAVALTLISPRLLSLGGQSGTGIPPDVNDVPGTKESVGSSWPRQLLFWRLAPFARFVPPFPVIPRGLLQTPQLFLPKEVCEQLYLEISHLCVNHPL